MNLVRLTMSEETYDVLARIVHEHRYTFDEQTVMRSLKETLETRELRVAQTDGGTDDELRKMHPLSELDDEDVEDTDVPAAGAEDTMGGFGEEAADAT